MRASAIFAAAVLTIALADQGSAQQDPGEKLYVTDLGCSVCHGGSGEGGVGPALKNTKLTFPDFLKQIREPREAMPPFSPRLASDDDLMRVYEWLTAEVAKK